MKKVFYAGLIFGGIMGVIIALSMDYLLGASLGGGWSDAVAKDLNRMFDASLSPQNIIVILGVVIVIGIIGAFGAFIGGVSFIFIANLFMILTKTRDQ